ncbi:YqaJ domain-containing protein [Aphis craccivora]|uniref:YqaJ domain-containing protein n=1 Tax=Aphis craccivora TaxID=307492 RepID=A0A6G0VPD3_APHCR|nr:YqaJ domain-containing protein [Aphis craccivora]
MTGNRAISMFAIFDYFKSNPKQLKKGELSFNAGYVCKIHSASGLIQGEVKASMKSIQYKVKVFLNDGVIYECMCTCPRGLTICHHMATISLFAHHNCSSTDSIFSWNVRNSNVENTKTIIDLYPACPYKATISLPNKNQNNFKKALEQLGTPIGMSWLLKPEPDVEVQFEQLSVVLVNDVIVSDEYKTSTTKTQLLKNKLSVSTEIILKVAQETIDLLQVCMEIYLQSAIKKKYNPSLFKSLNNEYITTGVHAIEWGLNNEDAALKFLQETENVVIQKTGLWLHKCGYLGE